jgi:hypothetical protein
MNNGQMTLSPQRLKRRHRRVQSKKSIQIEHRFSWNVNAGTHGIVLSLAVRHNDIQSIGCTTLKEDHQPLGVSARLHRAERRARKKTRQRRRAHHGKCAIAKKNATRNRHSKLPVRNQCWLARSSRLEAQAISSEIPATPAAIPRSCLNPAAGAYPPASAWQYLLSPD